MLLGLYPSLDEEGGCLVQGKYGRSSSALACRSEENGVLISTAGLCCRCLEMRLNLVRGEASVKRGKG